jgi:heme/copper-type cytochrome/quinol oxidase subunit 2
MGRADATSMGFGLGAWSTLARGAAASTNLQETNAIVWVLLGISISGAIVTFGFLVYTVWKWRDRATSRRPYG